MSLRHAMSAAGLLLVAAAAGAQAQGAGTTPATPPVLNQTFESDQEGWMGMGGNANVQVTHDPAHVKEGKGALEFGYSVDKGDINIMMLPTAPETMAKVRSIHLWVMADYDTTVGCVLQEKDGGRYIALFRAPKGKWQEVELGTADFILSDNAGDPKDADGKLDMDQVEGMAVADAMTLMAQSDNDMIKKLFGVKVGPHKLWMDGLRLQTTPVAAGFASLSGDVKVDTLAHPQASWLAIGPVQMNIVTAQTLGGRALQLSYHLTPSSPAGAVKLFQRGKLALVDRLTFDAASQTATKLLVQVEEADGGKYNTIVEVPANMAVQHVSLQLSTLKPADDSNDANGKLDLDQIKQVMIVDAAGLLDQADRDNVLMVNNLRFRGGQQ